MPIDLQATRARIREATDGPPPDATATRSAGGYRDNDLPTARRARPVRSHHARSTPPTNATDPAPEGGFVDLDATPLSLDAPAPAPSAPPAEQPTPAARPQPESPADHAPSIGESLPLDPPRMRRIIFLATALPGGTPPFAKAQPNLRGEGLRFGLGRFTQLSGDLGRLLLAMKDADPQAFDAAFAEGDDLPGASAQAVLDVATAMVPAGATADTAPNLQPVAGKPLWSPEWIARFKASTEHTPFQDAQYFTAAQTALLPMLGFSRNMGLDSEKGLTLLTERAIQLGIPAAQAFTVSAAGPITSEALKREALVFLANDANAATLSAFQAAHGLTDTNGRMDAATHAAFVAALRERGDPPIMLPSPSMMMDQLVAAAANSPAPGLMSAIRGNPNLSEAPLADADPVME